MDFTDQNGGAETDKVGSPAEVGSPRACVAHCRVSRVVPRKSRICRIIGFSQGKRRHKVGASRIAGESRIAPGLSRPWRPVGGGAPKKTDMSNLWIFPCKRRHQVGASRIAGKSRIASGLSRPSQGVEGSAPKKSDMSNHWIFPVQTAAQSRSKSDRRQKSDRPGLSEVVPRKSRICRIFGFSY